MDVLKRSSRILTGPAWSLFSGQRLLKYTRIHGTAEMYSKLMVNTSFNFTTQQRLFASQPRPQHGQPPPISTNVSPDDEFQTLDIIRSRNTRFRGQRKRREKKEVPPPRYLKMATDQDWASVWPTPKTFHPASVPLPMHQGYVEPGKGKPVPGKFANLELMKIPNFLHLTPPAIKRHCEAIKKFCTPWPEELQDDYVLENLFPIEIITNDYCHSSPSIRDAKARIVTLRVKLSFFNLDTRAKDKMLRLVGERYNPETDELTLVTDCCPLRKQNYDYAMYLLTAVCHESWNKESWEDEKVGEDMEKFVWEGSRSEGFVQKLLGPEDLKNKADVVENYKNSLSSILNEGENDDKLMEYGNSVRQLFNLPLESISNPKISAGE